MTLWDRWEVELSSKKNTKLYEVQEYLDKKYKLKSRDFIYGNKPLYLSALMDKADKKSERDKTLNTRLKELADLDVFFIFIFYVLFNI